MKRLSLLLLLACAPPSNGQVESVPLEPPKVVEKMLLHMDMTGSNGSCDVFKVVDKEEIYMQSFYVINCSSTDGVAVAVTR